MLEYEKSADVEREKMYFALVVFATASRTLHVLFKGLSDVIIHLMFVRGTGLRSLRRMWLLGHLRERKWTSSECFHF